MNKDKLIESLANSIFADKTLYRNYIIYYDPPPIPYRGADWHFYHKDYDGPEDRRAGNAASEQACKDEIDYLIEDEPEIYE